jgi:ferric-dicitrate binding protein FerR (iron transport regulator)
MDELFLRYWDNSLTSAEAAELDRWLADDPAMRDQFNELVMQTVAICECHAVSRPGSASVGGARAWSRRQVIGWSGLAAGVVASAVLGLRQWGGEPAPRPVNRATLASASGAVRVGVGAGAGEPARSGQDLLPGETITTEGPNSSARLNLPDGSVIVLVGDTAMTVSGRGRGLVLDRGTATADIRYQESHAEPVSLATAYLTLPRLSGVVMTLGQVLKASEVEVHQGRVTVATPSGERLADVMRGEVLTVGADGDHHKKLIPTTPDEFAWDLSRPLPDGWHVGRRESTTEGPVVRPEFWFDPFHQAVMSQIRSNHQWAHGFFQLHPESVVRVRYRVERPGPSQLCFCVRSAKVGSSETGMMECNEAFVNARPREWRWLEIRAADMFDNPHAPKFGPPWIGFLVIFNTYREDLGLSIAEFQVTRPARPTRQPD